MDARFDIQGLSIRELLLKGRNLNFQILPVVHCTTLPDALHSALSHRVHGKF